MGYDEDRVILIENGDVLELDGERASIIDQRQINRTFIGETGFEEIDEDLIKERKQLANDGILTPIITINADSGELEGPPELVARGVIGFDGSNGLLPGSLKIVTESVENASRAEREDVSLLKERVRVELKRFIQKQTGARPVITPVVVEI
jgi:ribonuclease J